MVPFPPETIHIFLNVTGMLWSLPVMVQLILGGEARGAGRTREAVHSLVVVQTAHLHRATIHTIRQTFQTPLTDIVLTC